MEILRAGFVIPGWECCTTAAAGWRMIPASEVGLCGSGFYNGDMRVLLFSGKGGVGKTSLAAATGVKLAELNYRTLVMSIDPAHRLADSFDLETELFHRQTSDPLPVADRLWIQELNIQQEIKRQWQGISSHVTSVLRTPGISRA